MPRRTTALIAIAILLAGCATPPATPGPTLSSASAATASPLAAVATGSPVGGGCGTTQFFSGQGPDSSLGLAGNPWARAQPDAAGFVAYTWTEPPALIVASGPQDPGTKVLWVNTVAPRGHLAITAHPRDAATPAIVFDFPPASAPDGNYPSMIHLPTPGCWRLELTLGASHATIDLLVAPAASSPASPVPSPSV
ncbi:MAG TPA: hypothetical protein VF323_12675 [Candidatus Limnocylindrales bacterium]